MMAHMEHQQAQLEEMRRHHDQIAARHSLSGHELPSTGNPFIDELPPLEKRDMSRLMMQRQGSGALLSEIEHIEKTLAEFEELTAGSVIDPMNPYLGKIVNPLKDIAGYAGNKQFSAERTLRKQLNAQLRQFGTTLESKQKGGAVSDFMQKYYENKSVLPSAEEPLPDLKAKLADLKQRQKLDYEASTLSTKFRRLVTPYDLMANEQAQQTVRPVATGDAYEFSTPGHPVVQGAEPQGEIEGPFTREEILAEKARRAAERAPMS
jgi:hypothetical protein